MRWSSLLQQAKSLIYGAVPSRCYLHPNLTRPQLRSTVRSSSSCDTSGAFPPASITRIKQKQERDSSVCTCSACRRACLLPCSMNGLPGVVQDRVGGQKLYFWWDQKHLGLRMPIPLRICIQAQSGLSFAHLWIK